jgi:hypothetical protein
MVLYRNLVMYERDYGVHHDLFQLTIDDGNVPVMRSGFLWFLTSLCSRTKCFPSALHVLAFHCTFRVSAHFSPLHVTIESQLEMILVLVH